MRNRRVHEISRKFPIYAREAYHLGDSAARFYEIMTAEVPQEFHEEFRRLRLQSLQLLYVEELLAENLHVSSKQLYDKDSPAKQHSTQSLSQAPHDQHQM